MEHPRLGPAGGHSGKPFEDYTIPDGARLTAIHVYADWVVDALKIDYTQIDGAADGRPPIGGLGGSHFVFYLDPDEYLTGISGRCGWYIDSIRFHTNKRQSDLFGGAGGEQSYQFVAPPGYEVAGLFGRADWYIDALGLRLRPIAVRVSLTEGQAMVDEAGAEMNAAAAEEELDAIIEALSTELAAESATRRAAGLEARGDALADLAGEPEAMLGEDFSPGDSAELEAAVLEQIAAALEDEVDAELAAADATAAEEAALVDDTLDQAVVALAAEVDSVADVEELETRAALQAIANLEEMEPGDEETIDLQMATRVAIDPMTGQAYAVVAAAASEVDDEALGDTEDVGSWFELEDDGEALDAYVVVKRAVVASEDALAELEEATVAEAIAAFRPGQSDEGMVDVTVYSQVSGEGPGGESAVTIVAVASEPGAPAEESPEAAIMVTDAIGTEDDVALLEEEAVEEAIAALEADLGVTLDDANVTIYSGTTRDDSGQLYGAVVAVATPLTAPAPQLTADDEATVRGPGVIQLTGTEPRPGDLQIVEGIGPKIAALLIDHGINDLAALAATPVERLQTIMAGAGSRFRLADPGTWPRQAALAAAGDWPALSELQSQLKAGRA